MDIRPIRNGKDHQDALREIERLWGAAKGRRDGDKLDVLATLVSDYEDRHWPVADLTSVEILRHAIDEGWRSQAELASVLGSRSRASEVLNGKRRLSINAAHAISTAWHIPAELLIRPCDRSKEQAA